MSRRLMISAAMRFHDRLCSIIRLCEHSNFAHDASIAIFIGHRKMRNDFE
jgi:hypothetical protein